MALIKCDICGKEISNTAITCTQCGKDSIMKRGDLLGFHSLICGDYVYFGKKQLTSEEKINYFKEYPFYEQASNYLKWRIVDKKNDDVLLLCMHDFWGKFNNEDWEKSNIKEYLNGQFIKNQFSDTEKNIMKNNGIYQSKDPFFIFSDADIKAYYKFLDCDELIILEDLKKEIQELEQRINLSEDINWDLQEKLNQKKQILKYYQDNDDRKKFWLRTPCKNKDNAMDGTYFNRKIIISYNGVRRYWMRNIFDETGNRTDDYECNYTYRKYTPAVWININKAIKFIFSAEDKILHIGAEERWRTFGLNDIISLGYYPQENCGNGSLILWVIDEINNEKAHLVAVNSLDLLSYNEMGNFECTWEKTTLREWLNNSFYNSAFDEIEKSCIAVDSFGDNVSLLKAKKEIDVSNLNAIRVQKNNTLCNKNIKAELTSFVKSKIGKVSDDLFEWIKCSSNPSHVGEAIKMNKKTCEWENVQAKALIRPTIIINLKEYCKISTVLYNKQKELEEKSRLEQERKRAEEIKIQEEARLEQERLRIEQERKKAEEIKIQEEARLEQICVAEERRKQAEYERVSLEKLKDSRRQLGICQHCGGTFKGLFFKKCSVCKSAKDY